MRCVCEVRVCGVCVWCVCEEKKNIIGGKWNRTSFKVAYERLSERHICIDYGISHSMLTRHYSGTSLRHLFPSYTDLTLYSVRQYVFFYAVYGLRVQTALGVLNSLKYCIVTRLHHLSQIRA